MVGGIIIKDNSLKKIIWQTQLANAWRNYKFECSNLESKQKFYWSILVALISALGILTTLYSLIENSNLKIGFFMVVMVLICSLIRISYNLWSSSKIKIRKEDFIQSRSFLKILGSFNDNWIVSPVIGRMGSNDSLVDVQDFMIDTESWNKKREKIISERKKHLLEKTSEIKKDFVLEKGKKIEGIFLTQPQSYSTMRGDSLQKGFLINKNKKTPFISVREKTDLIQGLVEIKGVVVEISEVSNIENSQEKAILITSKKILGRVYDKEIKKELKQYSKLI